LSKKKKQRRIKSKSQPAQRPWWLWAGLVAAVVLAVSGLVMSLIFNSSNLPDDGTPKVVADQTVIDEGYQKLGTTIRTAFKIYNEGDGTLRIWGEPVVKLVEGC